MPEPKTPSYIYDIGANNGDYAQRLLNMGHHVLAVEPNRALCDIMRKRFISSKVTIVNKAVSSNNLGGEIFFSDVHTVSTMLKDWKDGKRFSNCRYDKAPTKIETVTLDELILEYGKPDFIKVDVEGYEKEVFKGLSKYTCEIKFECVSEFHGNTMECVDILSSIGYTEFRIAGVTDFIGRDEIEISLKKCYSSSNLWWGDIYAK